MHIRTGEVEGTYDVHRAIVPNVVPFLQEAEAAELDVELPRSHQ